MDPAETDSLRNALSSQGVLLGQHESTLQQVMEHLQQLTTSVTQLGNQLVAVRDRLPPSEPAASSSPPQPADPPAVSPPTSREPFIPIPPRYSGDLGTCSQFLLQCSLVFTQQPNTYATTQSKIAFIMSLLSGQAAAWALAVTTGGSDILGNYTQFTDEMKRIFDHPVRGGEAVGRLLDLQQGSQSVSQYAVDFRIMAASSGWGDAALKAIFRKGLAGEIKDELAVREESHTLNELIDLSVRIDNRIRERRRERRTDQARRTPASWPGSSGDSALTSDVTSTASRDTPASSSQHDEPMQLGRARLTPTERQRRMKERLCLYCGQGGHYLATCTEKPKGQAHQ